MVTQLQFDARAERARHPVSKKLLKLMADKKTNLCLSADLTQAEDILKVVDAVGPEICMVKTHIDIVEDFSPALIKKLIQLADKHHFLIFEDRKFADIGNTVRLQYTQGCYHIAEWAHLTNAFLFPGPGVLEALSPEVEQRQRGLLLLAELSCKGHFLDKTYQRAVLEQAQRYPNAVCGFISQHRLEEKSNDWLYMTPGVNIRVKGDPLGQQYRTPRQAIFDQQNDIIIVGRGIIHAQKPVEVAQTYRHQAWEAYQDRCK